MKSTDNPKDWINDWPAPWDKRSLAYREGVQAGYLWVLEGKKRGTLAKPRYLPGTAQLDAWFAGLEHGKILAKVEQRGLAPWHEREENSS